MLRRKICKYIGIILFIGIVSYITINFQSKFIIKNNILIKYKRGIYEYIMPQKLVIIPNNVVEIERYAFNDCSEIEKIIIRAERV